MHLWVRDASKGKRCIYGYEMHLRVRDGVKHVQTSEYDVRNSGARGLLGVHVLNQLLLRDRYLSHHTWTRRLLIRIPLRVHWLKKGFLVEELFLLLQLLTCDARHRARRRVCLHQDQVAGRQNHRLLLLMLSCWDGIHGDVTWDRCLENINQKQQWLRSPEKPEMRVALIMPKGKKIQFNSNSINWFLIFLFGVQSMHLW